MNDLKPGRPCQFCNAMLRWVRTPLGGQVPCEEPAFVVHPDRRTYHTHQVINDTLVIEPHVGEIPKGTYYTLDGKRFREFETPASVELWRSHWSECPGANYVRKKERRKRATSG